MATNEQKTKLAHPKASKKKYQKQGGGSYFLIWSGYPESKDSVRLGQGANAAAAWADSAKNIERRAADQALQGQDSLA